MSDNNFKVILKTGLNHYGNGICLSVTEKNFGTHNTVEYVTHEYNLVNNTVNRFWGHYYGWRTDFINQINALNDYTKRAKCLFTKD